MVDPKDGTTATNHVHVYGTFIRMWLTFFLEVTKAHCHCQCGWLIITLSPLTVDPPLVKIK